MKITSQHYEHLKAAISPLIVPAAATRYQVEGLSPMRFRWDLSYAAKLTPWVCANLYPYMNDDHIDTALRSIMREAGIRWASQA